MGLFRFGDLPGEADFVGAYEVFTGFENGAVALFIVSGDEGWQLWSLGALAEDLDEMVSDLLQGRPAGPSGALWSRPAGDTPGPRQTPYGCPRRAPGAGLRSDRAQ
jgi:hypothetical protein